MFGAMIVMGAGGILGIIGIADDAIRKKMLKKFVQLFKGHSDSLIDFCVGLLKTKTKDWDFGEQLKLKNVFHPHLEVIYTEKNDETKEQSLHFLFKNRSMVEYRTCTNETFVQVRKLLEKEPLDVQDSVKMERVLAHLHDLYQKFVSKEVEKEQLKIEKEQEEIERRKDRTKGEISFFLHHKEIDWDNPMHYMAWTRAIDTVSITLTFYYLSDIQYVYFYDKPNKKGHSKIQKTDKEEIFRELQEELDTWCLNQIKKQND